MATPRPRPVARARAHHRRKEHRAGRLLVLGLCLAALLVVLVVSAFGAGTAAPAAEASPSTTTRVLAGRPKPQFVASAGPLHVYLPVAQNVLTAVGYHSGREGAIDLQPLGRQGNEGLFSRLWHRIVGSSKDDLVWYQLGGSGGPSTSALDVGAPAATDVYAPVDGTVVAISDFVLENRVHGARIDLRPSTAPSYVVSLTQVRPDPALVVGSMVAAGTSKIGTIVDLSGVERQALARYTQDAGNNVSLEVHRAATLSLP